MNWSITISPCSLFFSSLICHGTNADATITFAPGDLLVLYTDGITEAKNAAHDLFGQDRLDDVIRAAPQHTPKCVVQAVLDAVGEFTGYRAADDDRTLLVAKVS